MFWTRNIGIGNRFCVADPLFLDVDPGIHLCGLESTVKPRHQFTFESIRSKNRAEAKDTADYYNITVSLLVRRGSVLSTPKLNGIYKTLDNGFPYDD